MNKFLQFSIKTYVVVTQWNCLSMAVLMSTQNLCLFFLRKNGNEPRHDKTNKVSVHPAKTQISLGIRPVWSESSLFAWRKLGSLATHSAHNKGSDQTGWMPRLHWAYSHFVGFVMSRLKLSLKLSSNTHLICFSNSALTTTLVVCILRLLNNDTGSSWGFKFSIKRRRKST